MGEMKEFYFGAASTDDEKVLQLIHLYSDIAFTATFLMGFKLHRQHACHDNTYLFQYMTLLKLSIFFYLC